MKVMRYSSYIVIFVLPLILIKIPRPMLSRYSIRDDPRKYATEPDSIVVRPLSAILGKTTVPSAMIPTISAPSLSIKLGYDNG